MAGGLSCSIVTAEGDGERAGHVGGKFLVIPLLQGEAHFNLALRQRDGCAIGIDLFVAKDGLDPLAGEVAEPQHQLGSGLGRLVQVDRETLAIGSNAVAGNRVGIEIPQLERVAADRACVGAVGYENQLGIAKLDAEVAFGASRRDRSKLLIVMLLAMLPARVMTSFFPVEDVESSWTTNPTN